MSTAYLFNEADASFIPIQDGLVLGRTEGHFRFADDPLVSRSHCQIRIINRELYVEDLDSRNQTRVNRVPLIPRQPRKVRFNDVIRIGSQRLILTASASGNPQGNVDRTQEINTRVDIQKSQAPAQKPLVRVRKTSPAPVSSQQDLQRFENQIQVATITLVEPGWEHKRILARNERETQQSTRQAAIQNRSARIKLWFGAIVVIALAMALDF